APARAAPGARQPQLEGDLDAGDPGSAAGRSGCRGPREPHGVEAMSASLLESKLASDAGTWAREHLEADVVCWLTAVAADGTPQASPISFLWDGATIFFYSQPYTPKLRNIARSPRVSFNLRSDDHADHLLVVEGDAAVDSSIP